MVSQWGMQVPTTFLVVRANPDAATEMYYQKVKPVKVDASRQKTKGNDVEIQVNKSSKVTVGKSGDLINCK